MKAIVITGPRKIHLADLPIPTADSKSVVLKTTAAALCGSDMHVYRGTETLNSYDFTMGHEVTGIITEIGSEVKKFKVGDKVVCPFTISCGDCYFCQNGYSSRCVQSTLFGSPKLQGCQAEYVAIPLADSTLSLAPPGVDDSILPLMADIFPTGYFAAQRFLKNLPSEKLAETTVAVVGCGPVAQCAIISALSFHPKAVFALDSVPERLDQASKLGAIALNYEDERTKETILNATQGRGVDIALEVVGAPSALQLSYDLVRPFGYISSVGVHNSRIPFSATDAYGKNVTIAFGRCPVRSIFAEALEVLRQNKNKLDGFVDAIMPVEQYQQAYDLFDAHKARKIVFTFN
ncbi:GroES-like protein [Lipomyces oligophaga]|uniref:GroES-like protein n=1 Tax=Lipomyces oligophaga TaxID=45792 RepID=UPI0034CDC4CC